ncbi:MAG: zinc-finger domain-containing protein [Xanthomonadales bacterium]|nr:zinc-finger domain-containing protein [Xanthomonadales bacterium]
MPSTVAAPASGAHGLLQPNAKRRYVVTRADLPLACPMPDMLLWNSHPRVYLPIEADGGESMCSYCGAHYILQDEGSIGAH